MIRSQFRFEANLTQQDYQKLGLLALRWSHIDHVVANCLKRMLGLTDEEAVVMVFPLSMDTRLTRMRELQKLKPLPTQAATRAFDELNLIMKGIQAVRNNVIHAVIMDGQADQIFELRSKRRGFTKTEIFEAEELTNYAGHASLVLRYELGDKDPAGAPPPLPGRPPIPEFLQSLIQVPKEQ